MEILPENFDGVFKFTNWTNEEFTAKWNKIAYTFPALKTSPMIIAGATPEEVQSIRKKFAKELAEREFYKTDKFNRMNAHTPGGTPALYTDSDLTPFIQKCLEPLPIALAKAKKADKDDTEEKLHKDEEGKPRTRVLKEKESLVANGTVIG